MKNQKLFEMVEKFAALTDTSIYRAPVNIEFQAQRNRLSKFYDKFSIDLRRARNEMEHELNTLKERGFDHKMFQLMSKIYYTLVDLYNEIDPEKPYAAAEKLVHYVLDQPNAPYINNLDFLAKHHLKQTNVDFKSTKMLVHPEIRSLDALKKLALELRMYMAQHPLIQAPSPSSPPGGLQESMEVVPAFFAGQEDKTKA